MTAATTDGVRRRRGPWPGLVVCAAALIAMAATPIPVARAGGGVPVERAYAEVAAKARTLIDVRSPREWEATGLPQGAATVTIHQPAPAFLDGILAAVGGDRDRPIALICATGSRSGRAKAFLEARGFTNVLNVDGGLFGAPGSAGWVKSGLPMTPCTKC